jgi:hypothetical protein
MVVLWGGPAGALWLPWGKNGWKLLLSMEFAPTCRYRALTDALSASVFRFIPPYMVVSWGGPGGVPLAPPSQIASPGPKFATSVYSQWNELKLTDIGYQRALVLPLYSDLSPHIWLLCGVAPPEIIWLHRVKISYTPLLSME